MPLDTQSLTMAEDSDLAMDHLEAVGKPEAM